MPHRACPLVAFLVFAFCAVAVRQTEAGDWPQILGPNRDGVARGESLLDRWPEDGPRELWKRDVGEGFSSVSVAGDTAVLFHRVGDQLRVEAMEAGTGRVTWIREFATSFTTGFSDDEGPRCSPVIHDEFVFVFGPQGRLRCLSLADGQLVWERDTHEEFDAPEGYFGAGSTPIVEGDLIVANVGSRDGAGIVAFDRKTGKTVWRATDEYAGYSSPVAATVDGTRHLVFVTRLKCLSLAPKSGRVRFSFPFGARGPTVNAANPVVAGDRLFVTAHYRVGAVCGTITDDGFREAWSNDEALSAHYTTPIEHEGKLYGIHGQERLTDGDFRCVDLATGKVLWSRDAFGFGTLIRSDDRLLVLTVDGDLVMLRANPRKYEELARARVLGPRARTIPALSNGRLFVRDRDTLKCLIVGEAAD